MHMKFQMNMSYKDYYKFARDGSIEMIMDLRNIKLLNRRLKFVTPTNTLLIKAIKMNWQEAVELLIDKGADIKSVSAILMNEIYPGHPGRCQGSYKTIPIVPGSDEYWVNKGHKILDHDNRKFVCISKEMTPFLKAGGVPCCHT
jgi:hypothetical protein